MSMQEKERDYRIFYANLTRRIRGCKNGRERLVLADRLLAGAVYVAYPLMLLFLFLQGIRSGESIGGAILAVLPEILVPGISFLLLSVVRKKLNRKRPYEDWEIDALIHRDGTGCSMPSRHVFSAAVIAMCILRQNAVAGIFFLAIAAAIAVVRVFGGVHYPRDVIAGYLVGVAAGLLVFCW